MGASPEGSLRLVVYNFGKADLDLFALLTYENLTRHAAGIEKYNGTFQINAGEIKTFIIDSVSDDLKEVTLQSDKCPGAQNLLQKHYIRGLP